MKRLIICGLSGGDRQMRAACLAVMVVIGYLGVFTSQTGAAQSSSSTTVRATETDLWLRLLRSLPSPAIPTPNSEDDTALLSILESHKDRVGLSLPGRPADVPVMLLTYFLIKSRLANRFEVTRNGSVFHYRDAYNWAIQALHDDPPLDANELRELQGVLQHLPPEPTNVPRNEILLVSFPDSDGSWMTRIYDKRAMPAPVSELFWIMGNTPPDAGTSPRSEGPSVSKEGVTATLTKAVFSRGEPIELTVSVPAARNASIDLGIAVEVSGGLRLSALGRRVFRSDRSPGMVNFPSDTLWTVRHDLNPLFDWSSPHPRALTLIISVTPRRSELAVRIELPLEVVIEQEPVQDRAK